MEIVLVFVKGFIEELLLQGVHVSIPGNDPQGVKEEITAAREMSAQLLTALLTSLLLQRATAEAQSPTLEVTCVMVASQRMGLTWLGTALAQQLQSLLWKLVEKDIAQPGQHLVTALENLLGCRNVWERSTCHLGRSVLHQPLMQLWQQELGP